MCWHSDWSGDMERNADVKDYPLLTVCIVASLGMTLVMILGGYYDALIRYHYPKEKSVVYVDCSYQIQDMARKLNITLTDRCIADET